MPDDKTPKRPPNISDFRTKADVFRHYGPQQNETEIPDWAKPKVEERVALKTEIETDKDLRDLPRPVTPGSKERLDDRITEEIFGSRECLKWYVDRLREALETMNGDKLYDFIRDHPKYKAASHEAWNREFAALVSIGTIPEKYRGKNKEIQNRRIAAAAQRVLTDYYRYDVFQLTFSDEKVNPWIYIDGKMGPYSVSVLNEYWMDRYSADSQKSPIPPGRSKLNESSYKKDSKGWALFLAAMKYLSAQVSGGSSGEQPLPPEDLPPHRDYSDHVREKYEALDVAGDRIKMSDCVVDKYNFDTDMTLRKALGMAYGEPLMGSTPGVAPKAHRILNLLAQNQNVGARVETMEIRKGDTLNITEGGLFTIISKTGSKRHRIQLSV